METKNNMDESERTRLALLSLLEDQKETLTKLQENEELFWTLAESTSTAIFIYQGEKFLYGNEATARITGYSKDELLQMNFWDVVHPDFKELVKHRGLARQRGESLPNRYEIKLMKKDGTIAWVDLSAGKISWAGKEAAIGSAFDITERKRAEETIEYERNLSRTILNLLPAAVWVKDKEGRKIFVNKAEVELSGKNSEDEIIGKTDFELYNESDALRSSEKDKFVVEKGEPLLNIEGKITKQDGNEIYLLCAKVPLRNSKNEIIGIVGVSNDITERKLNELRNVEKQQRIELQQKILLETATSDFIQSGDIENLSKGITEKSSKAFDIERVSVWIFSKDEKFLECVDLFEKSKNLHSAGYLLDENQFKNEFEALKSSKYVDANDPLTDPRTLGYRSNYLIPLNITSMLDGVINYSGKNYGTLCLEHVNKQHTWTDDEINFVSQLADQVAICLANKDRKLAEEKLAQTNTLLRLMSDTMPDMIWAKDLEGHYLFANKAICEKLLNAKDVDEPIAKTDLFFAERERNAHPENPQWHTFGELCFDSDKVTLKEMKPMQFDEFGNVKGKFLYLDVHKAPLFDNYGKLIGVVGSARDITEQKRLYELLKEHEEMLRLIINSSQDIICLKDGDGKWLMANDADLELFQLQNVNYTGKTDAELAEYTNEIYRNAFLACMETDNKCWLAQKPVKGIEIIPLIDGSEKFYDIIKIPIFYPDGRRKGLLVNGRDMTELINKQRELIKLQRAVEQAPVSIVITDIDGNIQYVNPKSTEVSGYTFEEIIGKNPKVLKSERTDPSIYAELWNTILSGESWHGEFINKKKNGEIYYEEAIITSIRNGEGIITNFVAVKEDITEKKKTADKLIKSEEEFRAVWESSVDAMRLVDENGIIINVNDAYCELLGITKDNLLGKPFNVSYVITDEDKSLERYKEKFKQRNIPKKFENQIFLHSNDKIWVELTNSFIEIGKEKPLLLTIFRNITEQKKLIEDITEARKKAEASDKLKSEFLAQISHEIRSPLNVIVNYNSLLKIDYDSLTAEERTDIFSGITNSSQRIIRTIDLILNSSEMQLGSYIPIFAKINVYEKIVEKAFHEFRHLAERRNLVLKLEKLTDKVSAKCDEYSLYQSVVNIIDNAIKYTKKGSIKIKLQRNEKKKLQIEIADTGIGMSEEYLSRLFTPFSQEETGYTRKFEGNGLGLSLVKKYCDLNNIVIDVKSKKGDGSTFTLTFENS